MIPDKPNHQGNPMPFQSDKSPKKRLGFKAAAQGIAARQGMSIDSADKILASSARKASPAAKKANPFLKRVKA